MKRGFKEFNEDHMTNIAAALAYYAFLAIPAALLLAVGLFGLFAGPDAITTVIDKLNGIVPAQATQLLEGSLQNLTNNRGTSITVLAVGGALALWSVTGAMQNVMWALNIAYDRDEGRGFVKRRLIALWMVVVRADRLHARVRRPRPGAAAVDVDRRCRPAPRRR